MKTIIKIIFLIMLGGALAGCTIVIPAAEKATNKSASTTTSTTETNNSDYQRPTPTVGGPTTTRPRPPKEVVRKPAYTRPTPTTTVNIDSIKAEASSKEVRADGRIDSPGERKNTTQTVSDTTIQRRRRVR